MMNLPKIFLAAAAALTTFGMSVGLFEIGSYINSAWQPLKINIPKVERLPSYDYPQPATRKEPTETPEDDKHFDTEFGEYGPDGYYYMIENQLTGKIPKVFQDFHHFWLETYRTEKETSKRLPVKPTGGIYTSKPLSFARIKISNKKISFTTEVQNGVSYRLNGEFVEEKITVKDSDGRSDTDVIVIRGLLTKWKNGVKTAESTVNFGFTVGC